MITLTYSGTTAHLPDRLHWSDEYEWSPIAQSREYSTEGALIVDEALMLAGRPITLEGTVTAAWISRSLCDTLQAWASLPNIELTLTVRGVARPVMFDHESGKAFSATPIWLLLDGEITPQLLYLPNFRFLEK